MTTPLSASESSGDRHQSTPARSTADGAPYPDRSFLQITDDVILLCVCKDPAVCHRTLLGEKLREMGYTVKEIDLKFPLGPVQGSMF